MKFTCRVIINANRIKVIELYDNIDNLKKWQDGFLTSRHLNGKPKTVGAKSLMTYKIGRGKMELIETITISDLPDEFAGIYATKTMTNTMHNQFNILEQDKTEWIATVHYTKFNGFLPNILKYFPSMFQKQTQKWLDQFKAFVELEIEN